MRNILVADPDPDFGTLYRFVFDDYNVFMAESVGQAQSHLARQAIDLIVTDWEFPDGTAQKLLDQLPQERAVPVVLVSVIQDLLPALPYCVRKRFDKPFHLPELRSQVDQLLAS